MKVITRGTVKNGTIVVHEPIGLPDGTEVIVSIEPNVIEHRLSPDERLAEFRALPFHGMWADREDMADSVAWVRGIREQWRQRTFRSE
jgi:hypothetical protein